MDGYLEKNICLWIIKLKNKKERETMDEIIQAHIKNYRTQHHVNVIAHDNNMEDMMEFLYNAPFRPSTSTLLRAVKNCELATIICITVNNTHTFLPN